MCKWDGNSENSEIKDLFEEKKEFTESEERKKEGEERNKKRRFLFPFLNSYASFIFLNLKEYTLGLSSGYQSDPFTGCHLSLCISNAGQISIFPIHRNMKYIEITEK